MWRYVIHCLSYIVGHLTSPYGTRAVTSPLGEFEQVTLLALLRLEPDAYGVRSAARSKSAPGGPSYSAPSTRPSIGWSARASCRPGWAIPRRSAAAAARSSIVSSLPAPEALATSLRVVRQLAPASSGVWRRALEDRDDLAVLLTGPRPDDRHASAFAAASAYGLLLRDAQRERSRVPAGRSRRGMPTGPSQSHPPTGGVRGRAALALASDHRVDLDARPRNPPFASHADRSAGQMTISPCTSSRPRTFGMRRVRSPAVQALAFSLIVTLGGGIALATVMFSVLNAVLLVAAAVQRSGPLLAVWEHHLTPQRPARGALAGELPRSARAQSHARRPRRDGRRQREPHGRRRGRAPVRPVGDVELLAGARRQPRRWGAASSPRTNTRAARAVALISARLWARRFQRDPAIVGRSIRLDDKATTVVGVMGADFVAARRRRRRAGCRCASMPERGASARGHYLQALGRLKPGVTAGRRREADLDRVLSASSARRPDAERNRPHDVFSLRDQLSGAYRPTMVLLPAAVTFVLLMACANAANLLLARAAVPAA